MVSWTPVLGALKSRIARRFSTTESRFRCAVTSGFVMATVGMLTFGGGGVGSADDLFGGLGALFGVSPSPQYTQASAPRTARAHYRWSRVAYRRSNTARRTAVARKEGGRGEGKRGESARAEGAPVRLGRASMCVRLCDGFAFPVGAYHGEGDRASHEATCQSECPGARTALYVLPNGSSAIGEAVEVKSGRSYSQLPAAFHYTTFIQEACSCHPQEGNRIASLLRDYTLRRGDAIMTRTGFKVFHGASQFPYRQKDFVSLAKSHDIHDGQRATFHAIERASLPAPVNVADSQPAKALQRQANLNP